MHAGMERLTIRRFQSVRNRIVVTISQNVVHLLIWSTHIGKCFIWTEAYICLDERRRILLQSHMDFRCGK